MKVVPAAFFQSDAVEKLLIDGLSGLMVKRLGVPTYDNERYLAAHALTFVLSGGLQVEDEAGELSVVNAGEFIFLPKGLYFISDLIPDTGAFHAVVCFFGGQLLEEWADGLEAEISLADVPHGGPLVLNASDPVKLFLEQAMALYGGGNTIVGELTTVKLRELLYWISRSTGGAHLAAAVTALRTRQRRPLQALMESNFAKPLAVEDYAYLSGRSASTFHRDFKRIFGEGPKAWLRRRRLEVARDRLLHGPKSVSEVAASLGYGNSSHFIKIFKEAYGESPKQYVMRERIK